MPPNRTPPISLTDKILFRKLANPELVDVRPTPKNARTGTPRIDDEFDDYDYQAHHTSHPSPSRHGGRSHKKRGHRKKRMHGSRSRKTPTPTSPESLGELSRPSRRSSERFLGERSPDEHHDDDRHGDRRHSNHRHWEERETRSAEESPNAHLYSANNYRRTPRSHRKGSDHQSSLFEQHLSAELQKSATSTHTPLRTPRHEYQHDSDPEDECFSTSHTPRDLEPPTLEAIGRIDIDENNTDVKLEKRGYLIELQKFKRMGVVLTKDYTMNDSLEDIKFEYDSHNLNFDMIDKREFMKESIKYISWGLEGANRQWGPIMHLNGWSDELTKDMIKFNRPLERIYKQYWRRSTTSPIMELAWIFFGSMFAWHMKSQYGPVMDLVTSVASSALSGGFGGGAQAPRFGGSTFGQPSATAPRAPPAPTNPNMFGVPVPARQDKPVPFDIPQPSRTKRRTLKRPRFDDGSRQAVTPDTAVSWLPAV